MTSEEKPVVRVNWIACGGRGLCHEVAPELIDLDPWGYPLVRDEASTHPAHAHAAAAVCPLQALTVLPATR